MQTVLNTLGEFVAHEWRFLLLIPLLALLAYAWAVFFTTKRFLEWTTKLWPLSARMHFELGRFLDRDEPGKAEAELKRAISLKPEMREAYYALANLQLDKQDRLDDAETTVRQMLRQFPGDPIGYCFQGILRDRRECYPEAEKAFRMANAAAPDFAWPCSLLGQLLRDKLNNRLGAEIAYRQAIRNQPDNWANYLHLGNLLMEARRFEDAATCYQMAARKNRGDAGSQINLGLALIGAQRIEEARKVLPQAMRAQPKSAFTELRLGRLLRQLKNRSKAEAAFRRAIDKDPSLLDAYDELSQVLDETPTGMAEAEQVCREGLKIDGEDQQLNYDLSLLLRRMHREDEAIPFLEKILAGDPDDFDSCLGLAAIHKRCGDNDSFLKYAEKARALVPADEPYSLACLEGIFDNRERAFEHLKQAVQPASFSRWWAWQDPDLQFLRDDPRFVEIVGPRPDPEHAAA